MSFKTKLTITILTLSLSTITLNNVWAWVEPTTIPPGNNIFAPINSSAFGQSKIGGLILNIGNAAHGLIVKYGLVGIGTDDPQAKLDVAGKIRSTGLEVNSTTEGVLFPRMTTVERNAISNPPEGLLIFNKDDGVKQLEIHTNGAWKPISSAGDNIPKGTIVAFNKLECPIGWAPADGTQGTPDLRGMFIRGLDTSGIVDPNRTIGSYQGDIFKSHYHSTVQMIGNNSIDGVDSVTTYSGEHHNEARNTGSTGDSETRPKNIALVYCVKITSENYSSNLPNTPQNLPGETFWQSNGLNIYYSDGSVGVGTSNPEQKMEVAGNVKATGFCLGADCRTGWPIGQTWWETNVYTVFVATSCWTDMCGYSTCWGNKETRRDYTLKLIGPENRQAVLGTTTYVLIGSAPWSESTGYCNWYWW